MIDNREDLERAVSTGQADQLVGKVENSWFDAKTQPYDTGTDVGRRALAKDIAAFANANGGVIIVGARTKTSGTHQGDEVVDVPGIEQQRVDTNQYSKLADSWIYPPVVGLDIRWFPLADKPTRGVVAVRVPPQPEALKPFLVVKTVDGGKIVESFFGYAERRRDANEPMGVQDLQRALRTGLNFQQSIDDRFKALGARLDALAEAQTQRLPDTVRYVDERVSSAHAASDFEDDRALILAAYPLEPATLRTLFDTGATSIRSRLERPPILRAGGWDLATQRHSDIVRGQMVRIRGFRKILDLYRDGTFVFGCDASDGFLAWTSPEQQLHPIGIVEVVYSFFTFYHLVINDLDAMPSQVGVRAYLRNLHKGELKTKLGAGVYNSRWQAVAENIRVAPDDAVTLETQFDAKTFDPAVAAFELLREVYLWFGLEETKVPYVATRDGRRVVDPESIRRA